MEDAITDALQEEEEVKEEPLVEVAQSQSNQVFFHWADGNNGNQFHNVLFKYDLETNTLGKIQDDCLEMTYWDIVQVDQDVYAYKDTPPSLTCYSNLTSGCI